MSTDIKPGQTWKDRSGDAQVRVREVTDTHVYYTWAKGAILPGLQGSRYVENFLEFFELVTSAVLFDPSKVKAGDTVTLEDRRSNMHDSSIEPDPNWLLKGKVRDIHVTHSDSDGTPYAWNVRIGHTPYLMGTTDDTYTLTDHRPAPKPLPTANGSIIRRNRGYGQPEFHLIGSQWMGAGSGNVAADPNAWADGWTLVRDAGALADPPAAPAPPAPTLEELAQAIRGTNTIIRAFDNGHKSIQVVDHEAAARVLKLLRGES